MQGVEALVVSILEEIPGLRHKDSFTNHVAILSTGKDLRFSSEHPHILPFVQDDISVFELLLIDLPDDTAQCPYCAEGFPWISRSPASEYGNEPQQETASALAEAVRFCR